MVYHQPIAHNYCGHQFGSWAGQLGDGRAHTLGNIKNGKIYELQLKGSGFTPFSRHADGNSVFSSTVREFLASELMAGLEVPTTRAVSIVRSEDLVKRDPMYNGEIKVERAAVLLRTCVSFLRFGSLQVCNMTGSMYSPIPVDNRRTLGPICDYIIKVNFPDILDMDSDPYEELFQIIVIGSAELVAQWQSIGFVHGVLNTDNMSLANVTIDYGPFAFMDYFSKDYVSNATDEYERYSFRRQPEVVKWNLNRLAEAMDPLVPVKDLKAIVGKQFDVVYSKCYYKLMREKLGLVDSTELVKKVIDELIEVMHYCGTNYTNFFRILSEQNQEFSLEEIVPKIVSQSCPTEFMLKNIRAYPQLAKIDASKLFENDEGFNTSFINEQKSRLETVERLKNKSCKDRIEKESELWHIWLTKYSSLPRVKITSTIKYILTNHIARKIINELEMFEPLEQRELMNKVLKVMQNPCVSDSWFEEIYWIGQPVPVKMTCSS